MIKVRKIRPDAIIPKRIGGREQSAWVDLNVVAVSVNGKEMKPLRLVKSDGTAERVVEYRFGDVVTLHTGLAIELSSFTKEGELLPRSSTFGKTGLLMTNSKGVIDYNYRGNEDEWMGKFVCFFWLPHIIIRSFWNFDIKSRKILFIYVILTVFFIFSEFTIPIS